MSYSVDANVLLYASNRDAPLFAAAEEFLAGCANRPEPFCLCWPTLMAYLRIATHPRIFARPLTPKAAARNIDNLIGLPHVRLLSEGEGFWQCYQQATASLPVRGNLVPDAHVAALLRFHDVRVLYTNDADFKKFDSIEVRNPFTP